MVHRTIYDNTGKEFSCLWLPEPVPPGQIRSAMTNADYLAAVWQDRTAEVPLSVLEKEYGSHLLVSECWRQLLSHAGILISSSISGGDLRQRFRQAAEAAPNRCWLLLERLSMRFPLPCPDGQGQPAEQPEEAGFFAESLGCRYVHQPGKVILFDTDETLAQKRQMAISAGFLGWITRME